MSPDEVRRRAAEKRRRKRGRTVERFAKKVAKKWRGRRIADIRFTDVYHFRGLQTITLVMDDGSHLEIGTTCPSHRAMPGEVRLVIDDKDTDCIHGM